MIYLEWRKRGNYSKWRSLTFFILNIFLFSFLKRQQDEVLVRNRHVRTEGTDPGSPLTCVSDVREDVKETVRCFFNDLWRLNQDRGRGTPSTEYLERVRAHDVLFDSYMSSYGLQQPHRVGGRNHVVCEEEQSYTGGEVVVEQVVVMESRSQETGTCRVGAVDSRGVGDDGLWTDLTWEVFICMIFIKL